ncbi:MAG TPA: rhomboid family intramembrane serine protease [Anaerolineales bacterium]|nr:rhomboid family intramembrane serine protease [Anaerolineales bacterium]
MIDSELQGLVFTWGLIPSHLWSDPTSTWVGIFTAMFLHGGWFHLISNMWIFLIFGRNVEARMGSIRFLIFYLLAGAAAGLLQSYVLPSSTLPMIGASGAIAGVLGAYLILFPGSRIASLVPIFFIFTLVEIPAFIFLLFWFVSQLYSGLFAIQGSAGSGIAWWAHIGGFVFGLVMVAFFTIHRKAVYRN